MVVVRKKLSVEKGELVLFDVSLPQLLVTIPKNLVILFA